MKLWKRFSRSRMPNGHASPSKVSSGRQSIALLEILIAPRAAARCSTISWYWGASTDAVAAWHPPCTY